MIENVVSQQPDSKYLLLFIAHPHFEEQVFAE